MIEPNSFQKKCIEDLRKKLRRFGVNNLEFTIKEELEWYPGTRALVEASVNDLKIWIYADGAHIRGTDVNMPFEALDYATEEELIAAFTEKVVVLMRKNHPGSKRQKNQ